MTEHRKGIYKQPPNDLRNKPAHTQAPEIKPDPVIAADEKTAVIEKQELPTKPNQKSE